FAAHSLVERPDEPLVELALATSRRAFPAIAGARLLRHRVSREPESSWVPPRGERAPSPRTPIDGLFLAASWVRSGAGATPEGACRAAEEVAELAADFEPPPPPPN